MDECAFEEEGGGVDFDEIGSEEEGSSASCGFDIGGKKVTRG